jgi:hypothetical protein
MWVVREVNDVRDALDKLMREMDSMSERAEKINGRLDTLRMRQPAGEANR